MLYDAATPQDYIQQLDDDWRKQTLESLRSLIRQKAPDLVERIHYKMLGYGTEDDTFLHLNAQKGYVSLYVGNASKIDPDGTLLQGLSVGKGCIRFRRSTPVHETRIGEFLERVIEMRDQGEEFAC